MPCGHAGGSPTLAGHSGKGLPRARDNKGSEGSALSVSVLVTMPRAQEGVWGQGFTASQE